jgi:NAD-dependent deacetylase
MAEAVRRAEPGEAQVAALRAMIDASDRIVALTGAGISTESGIPDFRSPGGIWSRIKPITYQDFRSSEEARLEDWRRRFNMREDFGRAEPNAGHLALARMAREGRLRKVITQNIDGLHQRAGLPPELLIEIHGNVREARCLDCRATMSFAEVRAIIDATDAPPQCGCGGPIKAAMISFGERLPEDAVREAWASASEADLFLVIGSSLQVQPAAGLPLQAKRSGARLAIVNRDATRVDSLADLLVRGSIGAVFTALKSQPVN